MARLCQRDLRRVVDLVGDLAELDDPGDLPGLMFPRLGGLLPVEILGYSEIDLTSGSIVRWQAASAGPVDRSLASAFDALAHEHPLINYYAVTCDGGPVKFSDLVSRRELRALGLYQEFFRPLGVDHQMAIRTAEPSGLAIGLAFNRGGRDFSERDRELVGVLRRPIMAALARARRRHRVSALLASADPASFSSLTPREREILQLVALGRTNTAIGHALAISPRTVAKHLEHTYRKLAVSSRTAAVTLAVGRV